MIRQAHSPYIGALLLILVVKTLLILWFILSGPIGLSPDEAQYWTWSQQLDYGYYSKPPAIAWQIALGTFFFGNTELGVRIGTVIVSLFLPLAVYLLARCCQIRPFGAFLSALMMVLTPLGILSSILSITDTGMILFWTLACAVVAKALAKERAPDYYLVGLCIGIGALYKWPIFLLWSFIVGLFPYYKSLRSKHVVGGIALSLLALVPTVIWNINHGWVSLLHVFYGVGGSDLAARNAAGLQGNFFDFWGAQVALVSPIIFLMIIVALFLFSKERREAPTPVFFCALITLFLLGFFGFLSLFKKVQGNWCDFAYPTAFVLLGWLSCERASWQRWLTGGLVLSTVLSFFALAIPFVQEHGLFPSAPIPYRLNPFRHNIGWTAIAPTLEKVGYSPENHFLFSSAYQGTSILSFYGPEQKRAYFFNLYGIRRNQFSLWPGMVQEQKGKDGYYTVIENQPHLQKKEQLADQIQEALAPYFDTVIFMGSFPLFYSYDEPVKGMLIFKCERYNGKSPKNVERY